MFENNFCLLCIKRTDNDVTELCLLPCGHILHKKCLVAWIDISDVFMTCRCNSSGSDMGHVSVPLIFTTKEQALNISGPLFRRIDQLLNSLMDLLANAQNSDNSTIKITILKKVHTNLKKLF